MAFMIPGNMTLSVGASTRFVWGWPESPAGRGCVLFFAAPPSIRSHHNRVVSYNNGVEQHTNPVVYTVDFRCEDVTGSSIGTGFQVGGGGLA